MNKDSRNNLIFISVLLLLVVVKVLNSRSTYTHSERIFKSDKSKISKILISKGNDSIELIKNNAAWKISGNDTMIIKQNRIDNFFDKVLDVKKETLLSQKKEKWNVLSVDDSLGTHLSLYDKKENKLAHYVFGRSKIDFQRNNIRINDNPNVYITNQNVINDIFPRDSFWGEIPKPDSLNIDSLKTF